jgi:hypothetical protein
MSPCFPAVAPSAQFSSSLLLELPRRSLDPSNALVLALIFTAQDPIRGKALLPLFDWAFEKTTYGYYHRQYFSNAVQVLRATL